MDVGNNGVGARNVVLKLRDDRLGVRNTLMNVRNDGLGVRDIVVNVGNDGVCVCDTMVDIGNDHTRVHRKFSLEADGWQRLYTCNGTHVEDKKDPVEVQLPSGNCVLITLRV